MSVMKTAPRRASYLPVGLRPSLVLGLFFGHARTHRCLWVRLRATPCGFAIVKDQQAFFASNNPRRSSLILLLHTL